MKINVLVAIATLFIAFSCKEAQTPEKAKEGEYFGETFDIKDPMTVGATMKGMSSSDTLNVQVEGVVESVCQTKGCWTNIADAKNLDETIFVKFKDYGFFLPLDCQGQELVLEGKAYIEETPVDELRHYAEDEGKSEEEIAAITEPERQYKFMASGAYLKNKEMQ